MLPLPSPLPDHVTTKIQSLLSSIGSGIFKPLIPVLEPLAIQFVKIFPQTGNIISLQYKALAGPWQPSQFATIGLYKLDWETEQYKCSISHWIAFVLLAALQAVNIFWFFLVLRILKRVIRTFGEEKVDERSEYDEEDEEDRKIEMQEERDA